MSCVLVIDYNMGNVDSMRRALEECGAEVIFGHREEHFEAASHIVLPGVGSFPAGMANLHRLGIPHKIHKYVVSTRVPLLGVCLGMQLLAESGTEGEPTAGLGLISGQVVPLLPRSGERIPHVGWNTVEPKRDTPLLAGLGTGGDCYFVHSFHFLCGSPESVVATTDYCGGFVSVVNCDNIWGTQFHPEKSQIVGMKILRNFLSLN